MATWTQVLSVDGDWEALYKDGEIFAQDHSLSAAGLLMQMGETVDQIANYDSNGDWFPHNLSDVEKAIKDYQPKHSRE